MVANMQKDIIIQKLRERGCRITKQRLMLLDIILEEDCSSCKEIFYRASKRDKHIGSATVYRLINTLEEIGAINRRNMYKITCSGEFDTAGVCQVELDDGSRVELAANAWHEVISEGLKKCGYIKNEKIQGVAILTCSCEET